MCGNLFALWIFAHLHNFPGPSTHDCDLTQQPTATNPIFPPPSPTITDIYKNKMSFALRSMISVARVATIRAPALCIVPRLSQAALLRQSTFQPSSVAVAVRNYSSPSEKPDGLFSSDPDSPSNRSWITQRSWKPLLTSTNMSSKKYITDGKPPGMWVFMKMLNDAEFKEKLLKGMCRPSTFTARFYPAASYSFTAFSFCQY